MLNTAALSANPVARVVGRHAHWVVLVIGAAICLVFMVRASTGLQLWFDELCTLFFADPAAPLSRVAADTHPPAHYLIVRIALMLGLPTVAALWLVNILSLGAALVFTWVLMRKAGFGAFAIAATGLTLANPAVLRYIVEGRNYAMAEAACIALAATAIWRLEVGPQKRSLALIVGLSIVAAAIHTYGGLFAGAICGSLTLMGVMRKDGDLVKSGLIGGVAASLVTVAWIIAIYPLTTSGHPFIAWLNTDQGSLTIWTHLWAFCSFIAGKLANLAPLVVGLALCATSPAARKYVALVALACFLFIAVPAVVSLVRPMIASRYLAIGAPALVMIVAFAGWRAAVSTTRPPLALAGALALSLYAIALAAFGPDRAQEFVDKREPYAANRVDELLAGQPARVIRIKAPTLPDWGSIPSEEIYLSNYRHSLRRQDVTIDSSLDPSRDIADMPAGLIGWSENNINPVPTTPEAALADLNLTNRQGRPLRMEPTIWGFLLIVD